MKIIDSTIFTFSLPFFGVSFSTVPHGHWLSVLELSDGCGRKSQCFQISGNKNDLTFLCLFFLVESPSKTGGCFSMVRPESIGHRKVGRKKHIFSDKNLLFAPDFIRLHIGVKGLFGSFLFFCARRN